MLSHSNFYAKVSEMTQAYIDTPVDKHPYLKFPFLITRLNFAQVCPAWVGFE